MGIVDRVRELAKQQGTTIKALEVELGLGNGTISRWDKSSPNLSSILKVAVRLNTSVEFLSDGVDKNLPESELTPGEKMMKEAVHYMGEADRLILAGALMQHMRATGSMNITKFLYPEPHSAKKAATTQVFVPSSTLKK